MKYGKTFILLVLAIFLFSLTGVFASEMDTPLASEDTGQLELSVNEEGIEDNLQTSEENTKLAVEENDETLSSETGSEILTEGQFTYSDLKSQIGSGGNINLTKGTYTYNDGEGETIEISTSGVINGNGAVIDMAQSGHRAFKVITSGVTIKNLTIKNANYDGDGGAIYFSQSGTVTNCNFTNNSATDSGGAVYLVFNGDVTNCNFTNNSASGNGGAIEMGSGTVLNCNFTNNTATDYGGAIIMSSGSVENCNFTNNTATRYGGAIYFSGAGILTNCNFVSNSANGGSDIYSIYGSTADTCIFKTGSDTTVKVDIVPPIMTVDNFTTSYGSGDKLTFNLTTNSGTPVTNGNISISVYFKNNDSWVGNYSCLSGEGWTVDLPVGSYYAIFDTEYAGFKPINRTLTITMPNVKYYINVTSLSTNSKTVNITAKSDIPKDILWDGKLLFILSNNENITATYAGNGTWWALHAFDDYSEYNVSASYLGLGNVTVSNATIIITRADSEITFDKLVFDYGDSINVATVGAVGITAKIDGNNVTVVDFTIPLSGLDVGTYNLTVATIPDDDHNPVTKEVIITVNKVDSTLTVGDIVFDYGGSGFTVVSYIGADGVNASVVGQSGAVVKVNGTNISVSGLDVGTYTLTVTAIADANHNNVTKNATITVNKLKTELTGSAITATYNVNKDLLITLKDSNGKALSGVDVTVDLNGAKTYTTDNNGQIKVSTKALPAKTYTAKIIFNGNANYDKSTKDVKVTVNKAANPLKVKGKTLKIKFKKLKKKTQKLKVTKVVKFTKKGQGTLTYKKVKGNKKISINKKNGKVTIKKGLKKGTYKVKVKIKAKGNANYKASSFKTITFKIKIK